MKRIPVIWIIALVVLLVAASVFLTAAIRKASSVVSKRMAVSKFASQVDAIYKTATANLAEGRLDEAMFEFQRLIEDYPESQRVAEALHALGEIYEKKGLLLEAKKAHEELITSHSDSALVKESQQALGNLNITILFSPLRTEESRIYEVRPGDNLSMIAKRFNTTVELLMKANDLKTTIIKPRTQLKVATGRFSVVVDKSQNVLTLKLNENVFKLYPVSTGKDGSTPTGAFKIKNKLVDPVWYSAGAIVEPDSPENILGSRWMGLSKPGYGIHGTTEPESIGKHITAGCIRMTNRDVEELFTILPRGTEVIIVD